MHFTKTQIFVLCIWFIYDQKIVLCSAKPTINTGVPAPSSWDNNGAFQLLLKAYAEDVIDDLQNVKDVRLTEEQALKLKDKIRGLYQYLRDNPALMERRLYVGSKVPIIRHEMPSTSSVPTKRSGISKRLEINIEYEVCPSRAEWRRLGKAKDINDTDVDIYQPGVNEKEQLTQWFYYVTCSHRHLDSDPSCPNCCLGVDRQKYSSKCSEKYNYVMAYMRVPGKRWDWNWIQVPSSCNCAIKQLI